MHFSDLPLFQIKVDFCTGSRLIHKRQPPAFILVDWHDAVFFTLINSATWAGGDTAGVQAVFAQARQVHHEGVFELTVHLFLYVVEVAVAGAFSNSPPSSSSQFGPQITLSIRFPSISELGRAVG